MPAPGAWLAIGVTPIGYRQRFGRDSLASGYHTMFTRMLEIGLQTSLWWSTQRSSDADRIGVSYFTIGLGLTYYTQLKTPTATRREDLAKVSSEEPAR